MNTRIKDAHQEIPRVSLRDAAKALFDRYQSNNCKIDGNTNDVFLMEDLRLASDSYAEFELAYAIKSERDELIARVDYWLSGSDYFKSEGDPAENVLTDIRQFLMEL